jgi:hypothetical protein
MGYQSSLHLVDVRIKAESVERLRGMLNAGKVRIPRQVRFFFDRIVLDPDNFLVFKAGEEGVDAYEPDDEGTVPALSGKWYEAADIAAWPRQHCETGGRIVLHSQEGDGTAWGWEFDGRGRMRSLELRPVGKWV